MIVLDTNVVSELMRPAPAEEVVGWVDRQPPDEVFLTAITLAELIFGVARLPDGRRRTQLRIRVRELVDEDLDGQVLPFTGEDASRYGDIVASRERAGRPISMADAQIAAICRGVDATLATRNTKDFTHTGVSLVDPWRADRSVV